ncbi:microtubule organization protein AKNA [Hyla sarda]|uniref:microtubule organization protein AKNA n=1 Tax=Hyla sarda TaxID=327740 RepID=UPI0024C2C8FF|nr:microtubule organization protein AKNA [Hyla sarda]XP_056395798.1 microtubule organization protein AKNA [Hyla sarda]XP_056395799.1 microtubule organization protein AKNA [Hyla sarda]XP_056395800.1 microtubule organization protein AKNA [Hyla sarda]XP_056395801.1 microtubule organization protein AKNA [Hyla sarda]XP_056395802.1 microtubule organization protein AKNA [Hyla sarda]XP_056395803.1 microtubule organization protein AKNA [Hyla sarda]
MDGHKRQQTSVSSDDDENIFARYMDENGVIGMDEEGLLELDGQGDLELLDEDEEQVLAFDEEGMVEIDQGDGPYPGEPSDDNRSGDRSSLEHPSRSITLPSALNRHPPSRDQQLDMTEDEVDRGSSLGAWDGDEDDNWNQGQSELLDKSPVHGRYGEYDHTSLTEEQWDQNPGNVVDYSDTPDNGEGQSVTESLSPSSPPVPSTWDIGLMNPFGRLSITPRIEDETLPESSCTESGGSPEAIPNQIPTNISNLTRDFKQARTERSKPTSTPSRTQNAEPTIVKKNKHFSTPKYGRGQLNYPLPDLSKVGPKVKFPRDEDGYRPPQPRRPEKPSQGAPVIFKSPAEIVKEVLLSSTEKPLHEPVVPPAVPQEFKTPQQATVLVHQLQEDYHKLLTKYAEAENTIDRLRLGAKVHLYSDPPQPGHSVQMGTIFQGSKVMEFSIPKAQTATFSSENDHQEMAEETSGSSEHQKLSETPPVHTFPETSGSSSLHPPEDIASALTSHLEALYQEVGLFEELLLSGHLTPGEQQQAVRELRGSLDVLERRYLKAQEQQRTGSGNLTGDLDPQRELEEAIFQLGVQLEELQEQVESPDVSSPNPQLRNTEDRITAHDLGNAPVPSASVPIPALQTPYPQISSPEPPGVSKADAEISKEDPAEYLPQPLLYKHKQVERDYGTLLSTYSSFKSLPEALGVEQEEWPQQLPQNTKPHGQPQDDNSSQDATQKGRSPDHSASVIGQEARQHRRQKDRVTSAKPWDHEDHFQTMSPRDHRDRRLKEHTQPDSNQSHPVTSTPHQRTERPLNTPAGTIVGHTPSATVLRRASSILSGHRDSPNEGKPSAVRRMSQGSKTLPQSVSLTSPSPHVREQNSRTPSAVPSVSGENARSPQSQKSSGSSKSQRPSAQKKPLRTRGNIAQRRILSPETDSGFLGSESGRSPIIHKQRDQLSLTREVPEDVPDPTSNSPVKSEKRSSKSGDHLSRTRTALWNKRKPNNHWAGPSEASSPSPGPKSLTESESREHTDESGSEQEAYNNASAQASPGASQLLSPMEDLTPPLQDVLQSRTARDQAIHSLQKEVSQLRKNLEKSLSRPPVAGKQGQTDTNRKLHEGRVPNFALDLGTPIYRRVPPARESTNEPMSGGFVPRDHDPCPGAAQGGRTVHGTYTGTPYHVSRSPPLPRKEHFTVPPCQRCLENERKNSESTKTLKKEKNPPVIPPDCPLCHGNDDDAPRNAVLIGENNRHSRRRPHCNHWIMSHTPPVNYIQPPVVHYSPPIVYGTPASYYTPLAYHPPEQRRPGTPPPSSDILLLEDLTWPLDRALKAAKELKSTSRRMCRSLTMDLGIERDFRGSCLF